MSGGMTMASGQASSALNIGMAERTPLDAGDVAGGRDDAALAAADDDRLVLQLGIVALLDRRIEGVAVDMREMQSCRARDG